MQGKSFKPTKAQREDVMLFVACGMSEEAMAAVIGIQRQTLRKHFAEELLTGHARIRSENFKNLRKAARAGNVAAIKYLDLKGGVPAGAAPSQVALGKKEIRQIEAQQTPEDPEWGQLIH
jgi:hypothetical protein